MALTREEILDGLVGELRSFGELLRSLSEQEWDAPSRCEGWRVADVAAHAVANITYIAEGRVAEMADPAHVDVQVEERRGKTAAELADELERSTKGALDLVNVIPEEAWSGPAGPGFDFDLREGTEAIWYDNYVHGEDIRAAVGREAGRGPGLRCAVHHLATLLDRSGWGPATLALDGVEELQVGGGGQRVTGDPLEFVLVATGRQDPATWGFDETVNVYRA